MQQMPPMRQTWDNSAGVNGDAADADLAGKIVLAIEDEPAVCQVMKNVLEDFGCVVHCSASGRDALDYAARVRPHVILLDLMLPEMDGGLIGKALYGRYGPAVPIIIVSAAEKVRIDALAAEVHAFARIRKPFDLDQLVASVRSGVNEAEQRRRSPEAMSG